MHLQQTTQYSTFLEVVDTSDSLHSRGKVQTPQENRQFRSSGFTFRREDKYKKIMDAPHCLMLLLPGLIPHLINYFKS